MNFETFKIKVNANQIKMCSATTRLYGLSCRRHRESTSWSKNKISQHKNRTACRKFGSLRSKHVSLRPPAFTLSKHISNENIGCKRRLFWTCFRLWRVRNATSVRVNLPFQRETQTMAVERKHTDLTEENTSSWPTTMVASIKLKKYIKNQWRRQANIRDKTKKTLHKDPCKLKNQNAMIWKTLSNWRLEAIETRKYTKPQVRGNKHWKFVQKQFSSTCLCASKQLGHQQTQPPWQVCFQFIWHTLKWQFIAPEITRVL